MKNVSRTRSLGARFGLLGTIFAILSGCSSPAPTETLNLPNPNAAGTALTAISQATSFRPLPSGTPPPSSTFTVPAYDATASRPTPTKSMDRVSEMIGLVGRDKVMAHLLRLTGEEAICDEESCHTISNRFTGGRSLAWAKDYIRDELAGWGYAVEFFDWSRAGYSDQDLIVRKRGASLPDEEVYFVAHLDSKKAVWPKHFAGADDNASGVVDLLELARVLQKVPLDRTVVLFFSTGEEQGRLGVKGYLDQLSPKELSSIKYVVNLDMLGYDANRDGVMELWHGGHAPSLELAELSSDTINEYDLNLVPKFVVGCG